MKTASIQEIKQELKARTATQVTDLCLRLARFKKENKELLTFLLFEAGHMDAFVQQVKDEIAMSFVQMNTGNLFIAKKSIRKLLRTVNKYIRFTGSKTVEAELLLFFCQQLIFSKIPIQKSAALVNLFQSQLKKIDTAIASLHEDLQHDLRTQLQQLYG